MQGEVAPPKTAALGKREPSLSGSFRLLTQLVGPLLLAGKSELQAAFAFPRSGRARNALAWRLQAALYAARPYWSPRSFPQDWKPVWVCAEFLGPPKKFTGPGVIIPGRTIQRWKRLLGFGVTRLGARG